jgi:hypothetical protein
MNVLMTVGVVAFVFCILALAMAAACAMVAMVLRFAPALNGTIFTLTTADLWWNLRHMPVYPQWWPGLEPKQREKKFVMLVLNPMEKPEYYCGFDPLRHWPLFHPDKSAGLRFDFADRFAIGKAIRILEDDGLEVSLEFVETHPGARRVLAASRYTNRGLHWYELRPPADFPTAQRKVPSGSHPMYLFSHQKQTVPPRPR